MLEINVRSLLENINKNISFKLFQASVNKPKIFFVNSSKYGREKLFKVCVLCKNLHSLYKCSQFLSETVLKRFEMVKHNICKNFIKLRNSICQTMFSYWVCKLPHNSLLHLVKDIVSNRFLALNPQANK